jgi:hypothetical protein
MALNVGDKSYVCHFFEHIGRRRRTLPDRDALQKSSRRVAEVLSSVGTQG